MQRKKWKILTATSEGGLKMPYNANWNINHLTDDTLAAFVLNVGHGDAIVIRFPVVDGTITCGVVDCYLYDKTRAALQLLGVDKIAFMCATHPHRDHSLGFANLIDWCVQNNIEVEQLWDSGFRHVSLDHYNLIRCLQRNSQIPFLRITSGFETIINKVRVLTMAPSISLKNRYDTFGTNINNASIVLKLEYPAKDIAKYYRNAAIFSDEDLAEEEKIAQNTIILSGDAQFDSWAHLTQEFPQQTRYSSTNRGQMIPWRPWSQVTHKPVRSQVIKIPHHMSKNGISYEVLDNIHAKYALVSCHNDHLHTCPHDLTVSATQEVRNCEIYYTGNQNVNLRGGTIAVLFNGDGAEPDLYCLRESSGQDAPI